MNNIFKNTLRLGVLAVTAAVPLRAAANPDLNCAVYASEAMKEINEAQALGCGFGGPGWLPDYNAHFAWCASPGVTIVDVSREDQNRLAQIAQCKQAKANDSAKAQYCTQFANDMMELARYNTEVPCGFTDSRYDPNYQGHFNWCMSVDQATAQQNRDYAGNQIQACVSEAICTGTTDSEPLASLVSKHIDACGVPEGQIYSPVREDVIKNCVEKPGGGSQAWIQAEAARLKAEIAACSK